MKLYRDILEKFRLWQKSPNRKPILLMGARQVGKTWIMEQFGRQSFDYYAKFDFDRQPELKSVFKATKDPKRIIKELSLYCDMPLQPERTLIIFDEIQECEEALNCLKYFYEELPEFPIIAAGSLLGVAVKRRMMTVPVGKVTVMRMYPMTFKEFLRSSDIKLYDFISDIDKIDNLPEIIFNKLTTEYKRYSICGGMPEAVIAMLEARGNDEIDRVLQDILNLYELDFSKYAEPKEIPRIRAIWHSLPPQLSKENRKFIYRIMKSSARSKDFEDALLWLEDSGLIYRVNDISKPASPLSAYIDNSAFKIYACDCGLLRRLARLSPTVILDPIDSYSEFKGALAENMVLQSLLPELQNHTITYWTSDGRAEVDFVVELESKIIPIEVKSNTNISGKSLHVYFSKYSPDLMVRMSMLNLSYNSPLLNIPLPLAGWLTSLINNIPDTVS